MTNLSRNEMIRALILAIQKVHPDKHIAVHEDKLQGSNRWTVTVDGLGVFDRDYACEVLGDVRAAKGLDQKTTDDLVAELIECTKAAATAPKLGPPNAALGPAPAGIPAPAPAAPAPAPVIDYTALAAAIVAQQTKPAPAPAAAPGKI